MWQNTEVPGPVCLISVVGIAPVCLVVALSAKFNRCSNHRKNTTSQLFLASASLFCVFSLIAGVGVWGDKNVISVYQKRYEQKADKLTKLIFDPEVEITSATQTSNGLFVGLITPTRLTTTIQTVLGKEIAVTKIESSGQTGWLTPLMLANLAPLDLKIAGQPLKRTIAQTTKPSRQL